MSGLKYTDHAVTCDREGCGVTLWGSAMGLRDSMTLAYVRKQAGRRGWTSVKAPPEKMDQHASRVLDFCPACSAR